MWIQILSTVCLWALVGLVLFGIYNGIGAKR